MKPTSFEYSDPETVEGALELLAKHGSDAKVLAGGQSLVPLLNFRLAQPARLVDINRIESLAYLHRRGGALLIGTLTRQAALERSPDAAEGWPLLREALAEVAHPQIRNRGTVGGTVAHADPAAELPVAFAALDVRFHVRSVRGTRTLGWRELFVTHLTTSLDPDELLTEIEVPPLPRGTGSAFVEFAPRHGDFALAGAAAVVTMSDGVCRHARVALLGAADTPARSAGAEAALTGARLDAGILAEAARAAVADVHPTGDVHAGSDYRRDLLESMVGRALRRALDRVDG